MFFLLTSGSSTINNAKGGGFAFYAFFTLDYWIFEADNNIKPWLLVATILLRSLSVAWSDLLCLGLQYCLLTV